MPEKIQDALVIPSGTQIVVTDNDSKLNGRTGVVIDYPFGTLEPGQYYVRFPDRGEHVFFRKQIKYRKNVQKEGLIRPTPPEIMRENIIYYCVVGSTAYGMAIEGSDRDYRGIYISPAEYQWSLWGASEHFEFNEPNDEQVYELQRFIELALKANPNILEILSSPMVLKVTPLAEKMMENRSLFLSKTVYNTYNGYAMSQFGKLEQDLRNQKTIRYKHAAHLIRLLISGIHILNYGEVLVDVGPWRKQLVAIRNGEVEWTKIDQWRLELHRAFDEAAAATLLPDKPDFHFWNQFLIEARAEKAREYLSRRG